MPEDPSPDSLLGCTLKNLGRLDRCRLESVLGGGATAVVFLGVSPEAPNDTSRHVAVKVARSEPQWRAALEREWRNLTRLERAEQATQTHYFPRVLWPENEQGLEVEYYMQPPGRGWGFYKWVILVQELAPGEGVHDLLLDYPGLRLPEPLALAIAEQYGEMLTILHRTDLTCADRKLADLRWTKVYTMQPGDQADLARLREGERLGQLMVLDWNVSEQADAAHIALDLFHFGTLWHRMLLGTEPRFQRGEWRLEKPLNCHPFWETLSAGTQRILNRLLHPQPERRYRNAADLLKDVREQSSLWRQQPAVLWQISCADEVIEKRWAAVDLLDKLAEFWGCQRVDFPDFTRTYNSIKRTLEERPFQPLQDAFNRRDWGTAQTELDRLARAYESEPARLLLIERYRRIADTARQTDTSFPDLPSLWNTYVARLPELGGDERRRLKQWKDGASDARWRDALTQLWAEAEYYSALADARALRERGDVRGAEARFQDVLNHREILRARPHVIVWLDELLGNPEAEASTVKDQAEELRKASDLLRAALQAIVNGTRLEGSKQRLDSAFCAAPGEALLGRAYRLLLVEEGWRRVEGSSSLSVQIYHLVRWRDAFDALMAASPASHTGLAIADWEGIKKEVGKDLSRLLQDRQNDIRTRILSLAKLPVRASANDYNPSSAREEMSTDESLKFLIGVYREAFPDDPAVLRGLKDVLDDCLNAIRHKLSPASGLLRGPRHAEENYRLWQEVLPWVDHGKRLANIVGEPWPDDLSPEAVKKRITEACGCLAAVWSWLDRYLQAT